MRGTVRVRQPRTTDCSCWRSRWTRTSTRTSSARSSASPRPTTDSRWDWIAGAYLKMDEIDKTDRFIGENYAGVVFPGGNNPHSVLSGENRWFNEGEMDNYAVFGQLGFKFTEALKLSVGLRYTQRREGGQDPGPRRRNRRPLQPERPARERHDRGPVPGTRRHRHQDADRRCRRGGVRGAEPLDLLRGRGFRHEVFRGVERGDPAGDPRVDGQRRPVRVRDLCGRLQGRRLRRHAGERRAGHDARSIPRRRTTTRSASRQTCSTTASA